MRFKIILISLLCIILLFAVGLYIKKSENSKQDSTLIQQKVLQEVKEEFQIYKKRWRNKEIPELSVSDLNNKKINLNISKKPRVYIVWASWCSDCQRELPIINNLYKKYRNKVTFVAINLVGYNNETYEKGSSYYKKNNFSFPVYFDTSQEVSKVLEVKAIPTMYFVNSDNKIQEILIENGGEERLIKEINHLLE